MWPWRSRTKPEPVAPPSTPSNSAEIWTVLGSSSSATAATVPSSTEQRRQRLGVDGVEPAVDRAGVVGGVVAERLVGDRAGDATDRRRATRAVDATTGQIQPLTRPRGRRGVARGRRRERGRSRRAGTPATGRPWAAATTATVPRRRSGGSCWVTYSIIPRATPAAARRRVRVGARGACEGTETGDDEGVTSWVTGARRSIEGASAGAAPRASTPITAAPTAPPPIAAMLSPARRGPVCVEGQEEVARRHAEQRALEVVGSAAAVEGEAGQPGLDPALALDEVTTGVAGEHVLPRALGLLGRQLAVEECADPSAEVADHAVPPTARTHGGQRAGVAGAAVRGARWDRAVRSMARPRWIRERTVPSLAPRISAISS